MKRTGRFTRRMALLLAALLVLPVLPLACQPTPEEPAIVQKESEIFLERAAQCGELDLTAVPQRFTYALENAEHGVSVAADARVHVLGDRFPIVRVRAADVTQTYVDRLCELLLPNVEMYHVDSICTKAQVEKAIQELASRRDAYAEQGQLALYERSMDKLEEEYRNAPLTHVPERSDKRLRETVSEQGAMEHRYTFLYISESGQSDARDRKLYVYNNCWQTAVRGAMLSYDDNRSGIVSDYVPETLYAVTGLDVPVADGLIMTPLEAQGHTRTLMERLGLPYDVFDVLLERYTPVTGVGGEARYGYHVRCTRRVESAGGLFASVPTSIGGSAGAGSWAYEQLHVLLNDGGVYSIIWASPLEMDAVLIDSAGLLSFSEIEKRFDRAIRQRYPSASNEGCTALSIAVTDVYLGMQRIVEKDAPENGLLVPAWGFYGMVCYTFEDGTEEIYDAVAAGDPLLVMNAVDGSVIDPKIGY